MERLNIASEKCTKIISELDDVKGCGLIHKKRQGQGKPTKIYVMKFTSRSGSEISPELMTFENQNSKRLESEKQDFRNTKGNNKGINNIYYIKKTAPNKIGAACLFIVLSAFLLYVLQQYFHIVH